MIRLRFLSEIIGILQSQVKVNHACSGWYWRCSSRHVWNDFNMMCFINHFFILFNSGIIFSVIPGYPRPIPDIQMPWREDNAFGRLPPQLQFNCDQLDEESLPEGYTLRLELKRQHWKSKNSLWDDSWIQDSRSYQWASAVWSLHGLSGFMNWLKTKNRGVNILVLPRFFRKPNMLFSSSFLYPSKYWRVNLRSPKRPVDFFGVQAANVAGNPSRMFSELLPCDGGPCNITGDLESRC